MAKKKRKTKYKKPKWVGDLPMPLVIRGIVYNFYSCRKCVYTLEYDKGRRKRKKSIRLPGNKKNTMEVVCEEHKTPLLVKFKKCTCGQEHWGFYLRSNPTCGYCGSFPDEFADIEVDKVRHYYRLSEYYRTTIENWGDPDRWDCINRALCLECTYEDGSRKGIACKNCPLYEKGTI